MSITKIEEELSTPDAIPVLIEHLADNDRKAIALIHLLSLIDSTSDEERHLVINTAIEQVYERTDGRGSIEAMLMEMASDE